MRRHDAIPSDDDDALESHACIFIETVNKMDTDWYIIGHRIHQTKTTIRAVLALTVKSRLRDHH